MLSVKRSNERYGLRLKQDCVPKLIEHVVFVVIPLRASPYRQKIRDWGLNCSSVALGLFSIDLTVYTVLKLYCLPAARANKPFPMPTLLRSSRKTGFYARCWDCWRVRHFFGSVSRFLCFYNDCREMNEKAYFGGRTGTWGLPRFLAVWLLNFEISVDKRRAGKDI